ncbi:MAG TPA: hypothetical protein VF736_07590 [Pyrinomonadaceae bacterium]|jgi:hypothetical protein
MKSIILCVCMAACLAGATYAQGEKGKAAQPRPDLSGTWVLDRSSSNYGEARGSDLSKTDSTLVIAHRDPELRISKTMLLKGARWTKEYVYYTDGRGESNPMYYGAGFFETKTKWKADGVEAYQCYRSYGRQGAQTQVACVGGETTQSWRLSADGQTLTHTTASFSPGFNWGDGKSIEGSHAGEVKLVYRRAQQ